MTESEIRSSLLGFYCRWFLFDWFRLSASPAPLSLPFSLPLRWLYSPELQRSSSNASITQTSRYNDHLSSAWFWGSAVWSLMSHWMFCALTSPCCLFITTHNAASWSVGGKWRRGASAFFFLELIWNSNFGSNADVNVFSPPPAGVVPEVDRLWYPFLYVWTTEGETVFFFLFTF